MTISYSGNFAHLLLRWKGSIWKGVWKELLVWLLAYGILRIIYTYALTASQRTHFEHLALMFDGYVSKMPLTFLLGFYISSIVTRWWDQFNWVAWPDDLISLLCLIVKDSQENGRLRRHAIARYLNLTAALAWRDVSSKVRKRFPTINHLVSAGLMTPQELVLFEDVRAENVRWFLPLHWAQNIMDDVVQEHKISPPIVATFFKELNNYRLCFRKLYCYDWVCIPLVYTQVAALATYGYFAFCLIGRQFLDPSKNLPGNELDFYVPIFTIVQFLFYIGWFKVGQDLMRPFGADDDDIELNYILDRHIAASFTLVHRVVDQRPPLVADKFFMDPDNVTLPHTMISSKFKDRPPKLHALVSMKKTEDGHLLNGPELIFTQPQDSGVCDNKKRSRMF